MCNTLDALKKALHEKPKWQIALNTRKITMRRERPWALLQSHLFDTTWRARKQENMLLLQNVN